MKKFTFAAAALGALVIALPSIASAETVVINRGEHHRHFEGARAEYRMHHDWHPMHHHHDRVVIVRHHRY
jgi:hypothetical protein